MIRLVIILGEHELVILCSQEMSQQSEDLYNDSCMMF